MACSTAPVLQASQSKDGTGGTSMKKTLLAMGMIIGLIPSARAADGMASLNKDCSSCHNLTGPAPQTLKQLWARKAPDLFYAGNKYRGEWLASWLQNPVAIRPAGEFYEDHIKPGAKRDEVDPTTLNAHVALSKDDAQAVADALMKLKPKSDLIAKE